MLRSSHRSGPTQGNVDRSSNNSSPQLQRSHSPSPLASPAPPSTQTDTPVTITQSSTASTTTKSSESQVGAVSTVLLSVMTTKIFGLLFVTVILTSNFCGLLIYMFVWNLFFKS